MVDTPIRKIEAKKVIISSWEYIFFWAFIFHFSCLIYSKLASMLLTVSRKVRLNFYPAAKKCFFMQTNDPCKIFFSVMQKKRLIRSFNIDWIHAYWHPVTFINNSSNNFGFCCKLWLFCFKIICFVFYINLFILVYWLHYFGLLYRPQDSNCELYS